MDKPISTNDSMDMISKRRSEKYGVGGGGKKTPHFLENLKKGALHKTLKVKQGEKIPAKKLEVKASDTPLEKKRKQFAINAKSWKK